MDRVFIAIDPGASGGIAWMDPSGRVHAAKMPDTPAGLFAVVRDAVAGHPAHGILEEVHARPGQGAASPFEFGRWFGRAEAALAAAGVAYELVLPQKWMKLVGGFPANVPVPPMAHPKEERRIMALNKRNRKNHLKQFAASANPHLKVTLDTSDALAMLEVWDFRGRKGRTAEAPDEQV